MDLQVRYKITGRNTVELGSGRTINMASGGILFTTERTFALGERVEVAVNWPAQLDNKCPLKLVIAGRVVRSEPTRAAVVIDRYEFRTQGSRGMG
jgi:Tfp pilus assembly protein PilZ